MKKYVTKALHKFQHLTLKHAQYAPHKRTRPKYGAKKQLANTLDTSPPIPQEKNHRIQQIIGTFFYYACAVNCTVLPPLNILAEQQSNPTDNTESSTTQFLDYAATNTYAIIQYKYSNMILHIDSDTSYLSEPWSCSHTVGHYYLSSLPTNLEKAPNLLPPANVLIHTECRILKHVVASAAKAEVGGLFHNGQTDVPLLITLHELGFPQPLTPIKTDNSSAEGIVPATVRQ